MDTLEHENSEGEVVPPAAPTPPPTTHPDTSEEATKPTPRPDVTTDVTTQPPIDNAHHTATEQEETQEHKPSVEPKTGREDIESKYKGTKGESAPHTIDWAKINEQLCFEKTDAAKKKREDMWKQMDANGNGYLSLAEAEKGIRDVLHLTEIFDCKRAISRAFHAAKVAAPSAGAHGSDYVEKAEFRLFLLYLRQYFEYYQAFARVDTSDDNRVSLAEFIQAKPMLEKWVGPIADPEAEFRKIDSDGGGQVLFDEFCAWAIQKHLDLEDDVDVDVNIKTHSNSRSVHGPSSAAKTRTSRPTPTTTPVTQKTVAHSRGTTTSSTVKSNPTHTTPTRTPKTATPTRNTTHTPARTTPSRPHAPTSGTKGEVKGKVDWKKINEKLCYEKTNDAKTKRERMWKQMDVNGNGLLSLAEVEKGIRDVLLLPQLFDCKRAVARAFHAARNAHPSDAPGSGDYVERAEFRLLILYLRQYFEYYQAFARADTTDDNRIEMDEFVKAKPLLERWVGPIEDVEGEFKKLDTNGGGVVQFDEFCVWAMDRHLEMKDD